MMKEKERRKKKRRGEERNILKTKCYSSQEPLEDRQTHTQTDKDS